MTTGHSGVVAGQPPRPGEADAARAFTTVRHGVDERSPLASAMSDLLDSLIARAEGWAAQDPDPFTRAELEALISARDEASSPTGSTGRWSSAPRASAVRSAPGPTG